MAIRVFAAFDRLDALASSLEKFLNKNPNLRPKDVADLFKVVGDLREKQISAGAKILGDVAAATKPRRPVREA